MKKEYPISGDIPIQNNIEYQKLTVIEELLAKLFQDSLELGFYMDDDLNNIVNQLSIVEDKIHKKRLEFDLKRKSWQT